jgi:magnesium transporter
VIVDCAVYEDGMRRTGCLRLEEVATELDRHGGYVWLGLRDPSPAELHSAWRAVSGPEEFAVEEVLEAHHRPVLRVEGELLWLVLRTALYDDVAEDVDVGELTVLVGKQFVLTIRHGPASPLAGLRHDLEDDRGLLVHGPQGVLVAIVHQVVDDYLPAIDGFEHDVVEVEREVFSDERAQPVARVYALKREVRELLLAIVPLEEPISHLLRTIGARPDEVHEHLRSAQHQLLLLISRVRSLGELLDSALNATLTQVSLQQNADMRKISAWVAIAAVPTMVAGIYGMNFEHMPELRWTFGYPLILAVIATVCTSLYRMFRRSGWL